MYHTTGFAKADIIDLCVLVKAQAEAEATKQGHEPPSPRHAAQPKTVAHGHDQLD